jgi:hypothetical protein
LLRRACTFSFLFLFSEISLFCSRLTHSILKALGVFLVAGSLVAPSFARTWNYPDTEAGSPCLTTLQACADGTASGDTILIQQQFLQNQSATIRHSLTLRPGFDPRAGFLIGAINVIADTPANDVAFTMSGLRVGRFRADHRDGVMSLTLTDNDFGTGLVSLPPDPNTTVVSISSQPRIRPITSTIIRFERNSVFREATFGSLAAAYALKIVAGRSSVIADIVDNGFITDGGIVDNPMVGLESTGDAPMSADIFRNRILAGFSGVQNSGFSAGIAVSNSAPTNPDNTMSVRVFNNLISGQRGSCGSQGGAAITSPSTAGVVNLAIVNNTIVDGSCGVFLTASTEGLVGGMFNNIIARQSEIGFALKSAPNPVFTNGNNLFFGNGTDFSNHAVAGPGTRTGDPAFKNVAGPFIDYSLTAGSDAIDRGIAPLPPNISNVNTGDFDVFGVGHPRVKGAGIDIGAIEAPPVISITTSANTLPDNGSVAIITVTASGPPPSATGIGFSVPLTGIPAIGGQIAATSCVTPLIIPLGQTTASCTVTASSNTTRGETSVPVTIALTQYTGAGDEYILSNTAPSVAINVVDDESPLNELPLIVPTLGPVALLALLGALFLLGGASRRRSSIASS